MKRKIFSLLFVAISTIMFTSYAQSNNTENDSTQSCNKCCKFDKKGKHHRMKHTNPFEGIELSDNQKEQLKDLHQKRRNEMKDFRKNKNEGDTCKMKSPREMRRQQLDDLKNILTPEQYVQYLENSYMNQSGKHMRKPHNRRHYKHHKQNDCK